MEKNKSIKCEIEEQCYKQGTIQCVSEEARAKLGQIDYIAWSQDVICYGDRNVVGVNERRFTMPYVEFQISIVSFYSPKFYLYRFFNLHLNLNLSVNNIQKWLTF